MHKITRLFLIIPCVWLGVGCGDDDAAPVDAGGREDAPLRDAGETECVDPETLPETIEEDLTVGPGCVRIEKTTVREDATLTIQPGTTVLMEAGGHLSISWNSSGGTLVAVGTAAQPIVFTSEQSSPQAGDWECVRIHPNGSNSDIQYVTFEYGGAGCTIDGSNPTSLLVVDDGIRAIANSTFTDSSGHGLLVQQNGALRRFDNNTFGRNEMASIHSEASQVLVFDNPNTFLDDDDVIEVTGFALEADGTWHAQEVPYRVVSSNFEIHEGAAVTIEAGTTIELMDNLEAFDATLSVEGTETAPVTFTASPNATGGTWGCVNFGASASPNFDYAIVENAGRGCSAALRVPEGSIITNTVFRDLEGAAIDTQGECNEDWCTDNTFEGFTDPELECTGSNTPTSCE